MSEPNARATELHLKLVEPKDVEAKSMYQLVHKPRSVKLIEMGKKQQLCLFLTPFIDGVGRANSWKQEVLL